MVFLHLQTTSRSLLNTKDRRYSSSMKSAVLSLLFAGAMALGPRQSRCYFSLSAMDSGPATPGQATQIEQSSGTGSGSPQTYQIGQLSDGQTRSGIVSSHANYMAVI